MNFSDKLNEQKEYNLLDQLLKEVMLVCLGKDCRAYEKAILNFDFYDKCWILGNEEKKFNLSIFTRDFAKKIEEIVCERQYEIYCKWGIAITDDYDYKKIYTARILGKFFKAKNGCDHWRSCGFVEGLECTECPKNDDSSYMSYSRQAFFNREEYDSDGYEL